VSILKGKEEVLGLGETMKQVQVVIMRRESLREFAKCTNISVILKDMDTVEVQ
jgi:hypothetical protein